MLDPSQNGGMHDCDAALRHQFAHITITQLVSDIPSYGLNDKKVIEMAAFEEFGLHGRDLDHAHDYPQLSGLHQNPLMQVGDPQTALRESEAALALFEPLAARHPNEAPYQHALFVSYQHLGMAQGQPLGVNLNDTATALQTFAKMQAITQRLVNADAKDQRARDNLAVGLILIGETEALNEPPRGAATLRQALDELSALAAAGGDPFRYRLLQTETLTWIADAENRQDQRAAALKHLRDAQAVWQTLAAEQPEEFSVKAGNCDLQQILAEALRAQGDVEGALTALRAALAFAETEKAAKSDDVRAFWRLADCYRRFGGCYEAQASPARQPEERRAAKVVLQKQAACFR